MSKIYYFYSKDTGECFFFSNEDCAITYRFMLNTDCSKIRSLDIKKVSFNGTDIITLSSFKEKFKKDFNIDSYLNSYGNWHLIDFLSNLDSKIREEKLNSLLDGQ